MQLGYSGTGKIIWGPVLEGMECHVQEFEFGL